MSAADRDWWHCDGCGERVTREGNVRASELRRELDALHTPEGLAAAVAKMPVEDRERFLGALREKVCLLCGEDAPCYCAPAYDE